MPRFVLAFAGLLWVIADRSRYLLWHLYVVRINPAERKRWNLMKNGKSNRRNPFFALVELCVHATIIALIWGWI